MPVRRKTKNSQDPNPEKRMELSGHLRELRNRILVCVITLLVVMVAALSFAPQIVELLLRLGREYGYTFIYISPQELLLQYFSVSLIAGVVVTLPVLFYELWAFIRPGLKSGENGFFLFAMLFGLICFCVGIAFAYKIMLPFMLRFLYSLNGSSDITASISVGNYLTFLTTIFLVFGAVFELPMVSILLTQMGLMRPEWLKKVRKPAIVVIFFLSAVVTPPDVISQIMVAVPVIFLYQLSIFLSATILRLKREKRPEKVNE
ncbi:MAG: twin-arginine translocase subunit TatC [Clostridiales bacterium]|nr:twin-arginine translocase subunit TatC [Clostridiales bacterium]